MFFGFGPRREPSHEERQLRSHLSVDPEHVVILLGAGASVPAGCPVMRGFFDRAMDFEKLERFTETEKPDVRAALDLYRAVRKHFQITEEDTENVETLLSLADLTSRLVSDPPLVELANADLPHQLGRFIDAVITKSVSMPSPSSATWPEKYGSAQPYATFVRALGYLGRKVTVITLNYDCVLEFACYCMGLPYTYHREGGDGLEILKLHGSSNWLRCNNVECSRYKRLFISAIKHHPFEQDPDAGYLERADSLCENCGKQLSPLIIPPTWAKAFDEELRHIWTRAAKALSEAEVFVAIGISLPESDAHLRELLHLGLSSGKLRQALAVVGGDEVAGSRWSGFFRESWRNTCVEVRHTSFERLLAPNILDYLGVPLNFGSSINAGMLPISLGFEDMSRIAAKLKDGHLNPDQVDLGTLLAYVRKGRREFDNEKLLIKLTLDWYPQGPVLPGHGKKMPQELSDPEGRGE